MNCKRFEIDLADWVKGRLPADRSAMMEAHSGSCASCARDLAAERRLASLVAGTAAPLAVPELWPQVAARLDTPAPSLRFALRPRTWALGATLATCALAVVMLVHGPHVAPPQLGDPVPEPRANPGLVTMVAEMRQLPDPDSDSRPTERRDLYVGGLDQR